MIHLARIRNSAALIADIEQYRVANGRYPLSIVSVHPDYKPEVIGVKRYYYEASGEAYNLLFEHHSFSLGTVEIVMHNPLDQQVMTSHALDRLQLTPAQLAPDQTRGQYAVRDTSHPHWKQAGEILRPYLKATGRVWIQPAHRSASSMSRRLQRR